MTGVKFGADLMEDCLYENKFGLPIQATFALALLDLMEDNAFSISLDK